MDYSTTKELRTGDNPARWRGHLKNLLPAPNKIKEVIHHAALSYNEIGAFMIDLRNVEGMGARALEFAILTAARSGEVRGATWSEIDINVNTWTIPAKRMKMKKEHKVPLAGDTIKLLKAIPRIGGTDLIFSNTKSAELSDVTLTAVLRRIERNVTAHGCLSMPV